MEPSHHDFHNPSKSVPPPSASKRRYWDTMLGTTSSVGPCTAEGPAPQIDYIGTTMTLQFTVSHSITMWNDSVWLVGQVSQRCLIGEALFRRIEAPSVQDFHRSDDRTSSYCLGGWTFSICSAQQ